MSAIDYNEKYVPIFAPDGFREWTHLNGLEAGSNEFQKRVRRVQAHLGLKVDGYCGPATIHELALKHRGKAAFDPSFPEGKIVIGPKAYEVKAPVLTYLDDFTLGDTNSRTRRDPIHQFVVHYDVSYSARATEEILQNRGYSTHFIIDGDDNGTIYQCHNPTTKVAWHARGANMRSVGIDLNNPADVKYQDGDENRRGRKRKAVTTQVHGYNVDRLEYFPEQIKSMNALLDVLCDVLSVPRECPREDDGKPIYGHFNYAEEFEGIIGHYHLTNRKTDPAPLDWNELCPVVNS